MYECNQKMINRSCPGNQCSFGPKHKLTNKPKNTPNYHDKTNTDNKVHLRLQLLSSSSGCRKRSSFPFPSLTQFARDEIDAIKLQSQVHRKNKVAV